MLAYDIASGQLRARVPIGGDIDDIFFDEERKRVYVICGEGVVEAFSEDNAGRYTPAGAVKTAPRARTGLFSREERKLYVAAPALGALPTRVLVYRVR